MSRLLFLLIVGLAGTAVLVWLGLWQMERLEWKEEILAGIEARIDDVPEPLPATPDPARDAYQPVVLRGTLTGETLRILVSRKQIGAGYRLVTAFEANGRRLLLDRGFIRTDAAAPPRPDGAVEVRGNLHWPDEITSSTPAPDRGKNIWFARDIPAMAAELGTEPLLVVARGLTPAEAALEPMPVDTAGIPNDHLQYALTWFGLALVWAGMTLYYIWRARRPAA